MKKWWYLFLALKPERIFVSHPALWIGIALSWHSIQNTWFFSAALVSFLLFYGGLYAMNDIADYKIDKKDSHTKKRLIASGRLSKKMVLGFIIPLWFLTLYVMYLYSTLLAFMAILLWVMNMVYTWWLKAFPYVDILFISMTHPAKFVVGVLLCLIATTSMIAVTPFLFILYFTAVLLHAEKQICKLQEGKVRTFIVGDYKKKSLSVIGGVALVLGIASSLLLINTNLFIWGVLILVVGSMLRFGFSSRTSWLYINRLENTFQPR